MTLMGNGNEMNPLHPSPSTPGRGDGHALVINRVFDAPPALVFSLWSDPEHVKRWWHPRRYTTPAFEMDFRVGGAYRYCIRTDDGVESWAQGRYREIVPAQRLVFTFRWDSGHAEHDADTLISVTFEPRDSGAKTFVTFRQEPFASASRRDSHAEGWAQVLDSLAAFIAAAAPPSTSTGEPTT